MVILTKQLNSPNKSCKVRSSARVASHAGVVELADTPDLGSGAARFGGSSPPSRTSMLFKSVFLASLLWCACLILSSCSLGPAKTRPLREWCRNGYLRNTQLSEFVETIQMGFPLPSHPHLGSDDARAAATRASSEHSSHMHTAVSSDGSRVEISLLLPRAMKALVLFTSNGDPRESAPSSIPGVLRLLQNEVGLAVAHTRAAGASSSGDASETHPVRDLIEAARTLQALGYCSPRNLFLRAAGSGGWTATSAALARPELFRGLILESPLLDIENVTTDKNLSLHPYYVEAWGTSRARLSELSPMRENTEFLPLDIMMIGSLTGDTPPALGNFEWLRRVACKHPELRSVFAVTSVEPVVSNRMLSATTARGIDIREVSFVLATIRRPL